MSSLLCSIHYSPVYLWFIICLIAWGCDFFMVCYTDEKKYDCSCLLSVRDSYKFPCQFLGFSLNLILCYSLCWYHKAAQQSRCCFPILLSHHLCPQCALLCMQVLYMSDCIDRELASCSPGDSWGGVLVMFCCGCSLLLRVAGPSVGVALDCPLLGWFWFSSVVFLVWCMCLFLCDFGPVQSPGSLSGSELLATPFSSPLYFIFSSISIPRTVVSCLSSMVD